MPWTRKTAKVEALVGTTEMHTAQGQGQQPEGAVLGCLTLAISYRKEGGQRMWGKTRKVLEQLWENSSTPWKPADGMEGLRPGLPTSLLSASCKVSEQEPELNWAARTENLLRWILNKEFIYHWKRGRPSREGEGHGVACSQPWCPGTLYKCSFTVRHFVTGGASCSGVGRGGFLETPTRVLPVASLSEPHYLRAELVPTESFVSVVYRLSPVRTDL